MVRSIRWLKVSAVARSRMSLPWTAISTDSDAQLDGRPEQRGKQLGEESCAPEGLFGYAATVCNLVKPRK